MEVRETVGFVSAVRGCPESARNPMSGLEDLIRHPLFPAVSGKDRLFREVWLLFAVNV